MTKMYSKMYWNDIIQLNLLIYIHHLALFNAFVYTTYKMILQYKCNRQCFHGLLSLSYCTASCSHKNIKKISHNTCSSPASMSFAHFSKWPGHFLFLCSLFPKSSKNSCMDVYVCINPVGRISPRSTCVQNIWLLYCQLLLRFLLPFP